MHPLKNHNGSTLLISLVLVLLFTVLGLSLLSLSISGASKNTIRKDTVASYDLSQKGIDYLVNKIEYEVEKELGTNGLAASTYVTKLESILNKYKCTSMTNTDKSKTVTTGNMEYCIDSYTNKVDISGKDNVHRKIVKIKSIGSSGNIKKDMLHEIEIGADSIPDFLNYAIGTNKTNDNRDGDGNLYLHGGVEIKGDIKVEGDLITYNKGYGNNVWVNSVYPRAQGYNTENAKIVLKGSAYHLKSNTTMSDHLSRINFKNNSNYEQFVRGGKLDLTKYFNPVFAPEIVNRNPVKTKIVITDYESDMKFNYNSPNTTQEYIETNNLDKITVKNSNKSTKNMYFSAIKYDKKTVKDCDRWGRCQNVEEVTTTKKTDPEIVFEGSNNFKSLSTNSNVNLESTGAKLSLTKDSLDNGGTAFIGKNLNIGNRNGTNSTSDDAKNELVGTYYIKGDLDILGSELTTNAVVYVEGDVTIRFSSIKGKELPSGEKGSLIIFSKGDIQIANISAYEQNASEISAYFFTEKNFEMYGTGSNIYINGGISARRIALHGVRGTSTSSQSYNGNYSYSYDTPTTQEKRPSRLRVSYNPDIIMTYSDLRQKEPIIYQIDPSKTLSRQ